jgi:phage terminase large subunit GpA-like protein
MRRNKLAIDRHLDITCDGCGTYCDLDPIAIISRYTIPNTIKDPKKISELTYFWLCVDCGENGDKPEDFFIKDYFTEDELYLCQHCGKFMSEEELDELEDVTAETCLTCLASTENKE